MQGCGKEDCTICLEQLENNLYKLNCSHVYHRDCIKEWLKTANTCPVCRTVVDADHRYVSDGLLTEVQRLNIEAMTSLISVGAEIIEKTFPTRMNGYKSMIDEMLREDENKILVDQVVNDYLGESDAQKNLLSAVFAAGLNTFLKNYK